MILDRVLGIAVMIACVVGALGWVIWGLIRDGASEKVRKMVHTVAIVVTVVIVGGAVCTETPIELTIATIGIVIAAWVAAGDTHNRRVKEESDRIQRAAFEAEGLEWYEVSASEQRIMDRDAAEAMGKDVYKQEYTP